MNREHAIKLIENWNGEDHYFTMEGDIYTEWDVQEAHEFLENEEPKTI